MKAIHQLLPVFSEHDAIGLSVRNTQKVLRSAGYESEIFAMDIHQGVKKLAHPWSKYRKMRRAGDTGVLFHASTSSVMTEHLLSSQDPLAVFYHNITPASFFERWLPVAAEATRRARSEIASLAASARVGLAASVFSEKELIDMGYRETAIVPVLVDFSAFDRTPRARTLARLERKRAQGPRWLFVGRVAPNKCQHDVIAAFAAYRELYAPTATLSLVGGVPSDLYWRSLKRLIAELDLTDAAEHVNQVTHEDLIAHYRTADVFVCLSQHEGFCVPVLEAMYQNVPVISSSSSALPETVGDGGVLLQDTSPQTVAGAAHLAVSDPEVRAALQAAGRRHVSNYAMTASSTALVERLAGVFGGPKDKDPYGQ